MNRRLASALRFVLALATACLACGAQGSQTNQAELKISGYGLLGDRQLKKMLDQLRPEKQRPEYYDANFIEDAALLLNSKLLLASSDLSRIKLIRADPASGQKHELIVDCSNSAPAPSVWLRDGDIIEVPDKP